MDASQNPDSSLSQGDTPAEQARRLARAERVLLCMQHTLNHDLPNQLVAMQGLLQMLEMEEQARLSGEGKDYLRRLTAIGRRAQAMVTALKAVGRAALELPGRAEEIALPEAAQELAAEVKKLFSGREITYQFQFAASSLRAPRRALHRVLVELVRATVHAAAPGSITIELRSLQTAAGVELSVGASAEQSAPDATVSRGDDPFRGADRLGLALARELADNWGGTLSTGRGRTFTLLVPPL